MKYKVGDEATLTKVATAEEVELIAKFSGDYNPAHFDDEFARRAGFQGKICHGLFLIGMISNLIGMKLPGGGAILINQHFKYRCPVVIGDTITAKAVVDEIDYEKDRMKLNIECTNQDGTVVLTGKSNVMVKID